MSSTRTWPFGDTTVTAVPGACRGPLPLRMPEGMPTSRSRAPSAITSSAAPGSSATIRSGLRRRDRGPLARALHRDRVALLDLAGRLGALSAGDCAEGEEHENGEAGDAVDHYGRHYVEDAVLHARRGERNASGRAPARRAARRGTPRPTWPSGAELEEVQAHVAGNGGSLDPGRVGELQEAVAARGRGAGGDRRADQRARRPGEGSRPRPGRLSRPAPRERRHRAPLLGARRARCGLLALARGRVRGQEAAPLLENSPAMDEWIRACHHRRRRPDRDVHRRLGSSTA